MGILIRDTAGQRGWREPAALGYENEDALKGILHDHPALVPGVEEPAVACVEFNSLAGRTDVVVVDARGKLTLVECKLRANSESRREVVAQVMDYASRLWQMGVDEFEQRWRNADRGRSPFDVLGDEDGRIRKAVADALSTGRFNLVLAVDELNDDLKRIVQYLNSITVQEAGVIVVEFTHALEQGVEMLIPTAFGDDLVEAKTDAAASRRPLWSVDGYLEWCRTNDETAVDLAASLIEAFGDAGFRTEGGKGQSPSLNFGYDSPSHGRLRWPAALFANTAGGRPTAKVEVRFNEYQETPELRDALAAAVEAIPGIPIPVASVRSGGFSTRPNIPVRDFTREQMAALPAAIASAFGS